MPLRYAKTYQKLISKCTLLNYPFKIYKHLNCVDAPCLIHSNKERKVHICSLNFIFAMMDIKIQSMSVASDLKTYRDKQT